MSNDVFPTFAGQSWPVKRIPKFNTKVVSASSGKEVRGSFTAYPIYDIEMSFDYLSLSDWKTLGGFFKLRKGKFDSFLFDDIHDRYVANQVIGVGNGVTTTFQLVRTSGGFAEPIENVNNGPNTASIGLNGIIQSSGYLQSPTGLITFLTPPANGVVVSWTGWYYWRVRFNQDTAEFSENFNTFFELKKLTMTGATGNKV